MNCVLQSAGKKCLSEQCESDTFTLRKEGVGGGVAVGEDNITALFSNHMGV